MKLKKLSSIIPKIRAIGMIRIVCLVVLFILPILNGGTGLAANTIIYFLPLPLFLFGWRKKIINWGNIRKWQWGLSLAFIAWSVISTIFSQSLIFSIPMLISWTGAVVWYWLFLLLFDERWSKWVLATIVFCGVVLSLLSIAYLIPGLAEIKSTKNLFYASYGHNNIVSYLLIAIPLGLALIFDRISKAKDIGAMKAVLMRESRIWWSIIGLMTVVFLFSFSRLGLAVFLGEIGIWLFLLWRKNLAGKKVIGAVGVLVFVVLILLASVNSWSPKFGISRGQGWLERQLVKGDLIDNRVSFWQQAWWGFLDKPLFGYGPGTFEIVALRQTNRPSGWSNYAHSWWLQLLAEAGLPAVVIMGGWILGSGLVLIRGIKLSFKGAIGDYWLRWGLLTAVIGSIAHAAVDYDWNYPAVLMTFFVLLAVGTRWGSGKIREKDDLGRWKRPTTIIFSMVIFVFGVSLWAGEYFMSKGDWLRAISYRPWSAIEVQQVGDKIVTQDRKTGEKVIEQALRWSPGDPSMHYWAGMKYEWLGEKENAINNYYQAVWLNPVGNWRLYSKIIDYYNNRQGGKGVQVERLLDNLAQQIKDDKELVETEIGFGKFLYQLGYREIMKGNFEMAYYWIHRARLVLPEWSYFYIEEASLLKKLNRPEREIEALGEVCLSKKYPVIYCRDVWKSQDFGEPGLQRELVEKIREAE